MFHYTYGGESWECGHLVACSSCPLFIFSVRRADSRRHRAGSSVFDQMFGLRVLLPPLDTPLLRSLSNPGQELLAGHSWDCLFRGKQKMTVANCFLSILWLQLVCSDVSLVIKALLTKGYCFPNTPQVQSSHSALEKMTHQHSVFALPLSTKQDLFSPDHWSSPHLIYVYYIIVNKM